MPESPAGDHGDLLLQLLGGLGAIVGAAVLAIRGFLAAPSRKEQSPQQSMSEAFGTSRMFLNGPVVEAIELLRKLEEQAREWRETKEILDEINRYLHITGDKQDRIIRLLEEANAGARDIRERQNRALQEMTDLLRRQVDQIERYTEEQGRRATAPRRPD